MVRCSARKSKRPLRIKNRFDSGGLVRKYATAGQLVLPQQVTPDMLYGTKGTPGINPLDPQPSLSTTLGIKVPTVQENAAALGSASSGLSSIASAGIGAAGTAIGQLGNSLISHGLSSGVGNAIGDIGGTIGGAISAVNPVVGGIVSAGSGILGGITNALFGSKLNEENIANVEGNISNIRNTQYSGSFDDITATRATQEGAMGFNRKYIGSDGLFSNKAKNKYNSLKQQQASAVAQADANMVNATNNAEKQIDYNAMANYSALGGPLYPYPYSPAGLYNVGDALPYGYMQDRLDLAQQKLNAEGADTDLSNVFASGGGIHINPKNKGKLTATAKRTGKSFSQLAHSKNPLTRKRAIFALNARKWHHGKKHALGGDLQSNGADWDLGFTTIGNGGTHEMNPNEGVQMGMDNQGIPNLVEQGEVIYNNYVFSNRLAPSKEILKQFKLPVSFADKTFAQIAELISRESKERPNDPISKNGLQANMQKLLQAQELIKKQEQDRQIREAIDNMSPEELQGLMAMANQGMQQQAQDQAMQQQAAQEQMMAQQGIDPSALGAEALYGAYGGKLVRTYEKADGKLEYQPAKPLSDAQLYDILNYLNGLSNNEKNTLGVQGLLDLVTSETDEDKNTTWKLKDNIDKFGTLNDAVSAWANQYGKAAAVGNSTVLNPILDYNNSLLHPDVPTMSTWMQYAPYGADLANLAYAYFAKPDKAPAEAIQAAADAAGQYSSIGYNPVGNYLQYTPIDRVYMMNRLAAQANAQRRALTSLGNGNRNTIAANILAADYANTGQLGNAYIDASNTNWQRMQDATKFNRETNFANSQMALEADKANQSARQAALNARLSGTYYAQAMLNERNKDYIENLGKYIAAPFTSLGRLGERNAILNKERTSPANRGVWFDSSGIAHQSAINQNYFDQFFNNNSVINPKTQTANGSTVDAFGGYIRKNKGRRKKYA